ncbi:hypothetical protein LCM02_08190 [Lutimonas saemankumensis]|uniref:InlB B-repeat-containing protein n=1 Tax=Lutimonas saemankumensis TaxID=483016 RepID=UPI001CD41D05|nr:hypothetical protein [Lutimonas saemankumensis]MCA0932427.1 hypothetical protein [Lutimonas saemankumensis]
MKKRINFRILSYTLLLTLLVLCTEDDPIEFRLTTNCVPEKTGTVSPESGMFTEGSEIELKATANPEYIFKHWEGDAVGDENPLKITMTKNKAITAVFEKVNYSLTIEVIGQGTVNQEIVLAKSSSTDYESGTIVKLIAVPEDEWEFVGWSGDLSGTENPIQIEMDKAMTITAKFEKVSYALEIEIEGNGTVKEEIVQAKSSSTDYDPGTTVQLTAIPDAGWIFVGWSGDLTTTENPIQLKMDQAMTIKAKFEITVEIPISIWVFGNGTVEKEWIENPSPGDSDVRLTAHAKEGSYFVYLYGIMDNEMGDFLITENPIEFNLSEALWAQYTDHLFLYAIFQEGLTNKTYIPDNDFEQALIDLGYDDQLDNYVLTQVISRIEELDVSNRNIQSLNGIEDFISLQRLRCNQNNITNINLSKNPHISLLDVKDNELDDLDLTSLGNILLLDIRNNPLSCVKVNETQLEQVENPGLAIWLRDEGVEFSMDCDE